ncbi:hypothetical protein GCM10009759_55450 [Kitasatospora saccharophila]|uniref:Uncharacterized protein n=1 Tax=Kitasatospora saccharophila TaxID=407973 RepID=A0ABN2XJ14_9ACTN
MSADDTQLVAIDGRDALFYLIVRPGADTANVVLEHGGKGMSKQQAAYILRTTADKLDPAA